jgi:hypothetical protein
VAVSTWFVACPDFRLAGQRDRHVASGGNIRGPRQIPSFLDLETVGGALSRNANRLAAAGSLARRVHGKNLSRHGSRVGLATRTVAVC